MEVEYNFFGPVRDAAGTKTLTREIEEGATVEAALRELVAEFPRLEGHLLDGGELTDDVNVTVNRRNVRQLDGPETALSDGDVVRIAPPVVGGRR